MRKDTDVDTDTGTYLAFEKLVSILASSAWDMDAARYSIMEKGIGWSCSPKLRAKGVEVLMRSCE